MEVSFGYKSQIDGRLLVLLGVAFVVGIGLSYAGGSQTGAVVSLLLATAFVIGAVVFAVRRATSAIYPSLDEGGLRVTTRSGARDYVPFTRIRSAKLRRFLGSGTLSLTTDVGERSRPLADATTPEIDARINEGVERAHVATSAFAGLAMLAKGGQPLDTWLGQVRGMAIADYRERHLDPDELLRAVEDRAVDHELRAAAAHALIWQREHARCTRVMALLSSATPPLVTVAVTLATSLGTYVEELEDAIAYLPSTERAIARRMLDERPVVPR